MDTAELAIPAVVAVSKLIKPESFSGGGSGGGVGVALENTGVRQREAASELIKPSMNACSSFVSKREPTLWKKMPEEASCGFHEKDALKDVNTGITKTSLAPNSGLGADQLQKKFGKVSKVSSGSSKRSRIGQMEVSVSESIVEDVKGNSSEPPKCDIPERSHMVKQKNNSTIKRGDKRNGKAPKSRGDSFGIKNGLVSFNVSAGGNSFLGVNYSKLDLLDVTKHVEDVPLNELLDGSYKCPIYAKEKGKKEENSNEVLLNSVRKAWSVQRLQRVAQPENNGELNNSLKQRAQTGLLNSDSSSASRNDSDKGDTLPTNMSSYDEVQGSGQNLNAPATMDDLPLHRPKDVLNRLSLPPAKDLDCLLLDAARPALSSRNSSELRPGKPLSCRTGLPPFPWSHNSSAHFKSGSDAVKLSPARNTCQGRWVKVKNVLNRPKESTGFHVDLESLTFDQSLVPLARQDTGPSESEKTPSTSVSFPTSNQVLALSAVCPTSQGQIDEHSPRLLAAAQILHDIAFCSKVQNSNPVSNSLKRPSQKVFKTSKLKANNRKSDFQFAVPKSTTGTNNLVRSDSLLPAKKLKLAKDVKSTDINHSNTAWKGLINWSAPRSIRSSSSKLFKESFQEVKNYKANFVNKASMMPPPPRVMDNACSSQQKAKKVASMESKPSGSKLN